MSLKREELSNPTSCLNKASDDEPVFVLRAKDPRAAEVVRYWSTVSAGVHEEEKLDEAITLAYQMDAYRKTHFPRI